MRLTFEELKDPAKRRIIPKSPGVYIVYLPDKSHMQISSKTCASEKCFRNNEHMKKEYLMNVWKPLEKAGALEDRILYIGQGINLRNRLNLYKRVMFDGGNNHSGGVFICQIENCEFLEVEWREYHSDAVTQFEKLSESERKDRSNIIRKKVEKELGEIESKMIGDYKKNHNGLRPFANRNK